MEGVGIIEVCTFRYQKEEVLQRCVVCRLKEQNALVFDWTKGIRYLPCSWIRALSDKPAKEGGVLQDRLVPYPRLVALTGLSQLF